MTRWIPLVLIAAVVGVLLSVIVPDEPPQGGTTLIATVTIPPGTSGKVTVPEVPLSPSKDPPPRQILTWKFEDGPEDAPEEGSPNDVGPAWLDTFEGDDLVSSHKLADGEWITRAAAERLASENGYVFSADD